MSGWFSTESRARFRVLAIISSTLWCCAIVPLLSPAYYPTLVLVLVLVPGSTRTA